MSLPLRSSGLITESSVNQFFRESVDAALATQRVDARGETVAYIVNMLSFYIRSDQFFEQGAEGKDTKPLALMYADAVNAPNTRERASALRRLGDVALFVSGIFADSFKRRAVDMNYYVSMGGTAYGCLSDVFAEHSRGTDNVPIFKELSEKFDQFVDVLNEVSEGSRDDSESALALFERWQRSGSRRIAKKLRACGIHVVDQEGSRTRH